MGSHAVLNSIIAVMLLSCMYTMVQPITAERCQTEPEKGPQRMQLCSLGSFVHNMVQHINACLNHTTMWRVTSNNPIILVPKTNNSTQGFKKTFAWRQCDIGPLAQTRNVCRIQVIPHQYICRPNNTDKTPPNVKSVKKIGLKQRCTNSSHRKSLNNGEEERLPNPKIKEHETQTIPRKDVEDDQTINGNLHDSHNQTERSIKKESKTHGDGIKTTPPPGQHEHSKTEKVCASGGDILLYNPHCKSSSSSKLETPTKESKKRENDGVLKCSTNVEGICPGMNILHCLACMKPEPENEKGNVHALNNSKYSGESTKITIRGFSDHKAPLTEYQLDHLSRLKLPYDVQSLMQSEEKPTVVHVEDQSSDKISKYVIVENTEHLMVGIPYYEHDTAATTTVSTPTTTPPTTTTTTTTTPPPNTVTQKPRRPTGGTRPKQIREQGRTSFVTDTAGLTVRPLAHCLEPPLNVPREVLGGRPVFLHCLEPLTNVPREPLVGDFRSQGVPSTMLGMAEISSPRSSYYHGTTEIPRNTLQSERFENSQAFTEHPCIYNRGPFTNNCQYDTGSWIIEDVQSAADDGEDSQDYKDFENAATSSTGAYGVRKWPQPWNPHATIAPNSVENHRTETQNGRHNTVKHVQMTPSLSNDNRYQQYKMPNTSPRHHQLTQQGNSRHVIDNRAPQRCLQPAQQKPERLQAARIPEYLMKPPRRYNSGSDASCAQIFEPHQNFKKGITPNNRPTNHYENQRMNRGPVQGSGSRTPVTVPMYHQGQPTWGRFPTYDRVYRGAIPPQHLSRGNSYERRMYPTPMAGYSNGIYNPLQPLTQAPDGYTVVPPRMKVC